MAIVRRLSAAAALALAALCLTACAGVPAGGERVLSFHSDLEVQPGDALTVREQIRVRSAGKVIRHGIYREFTGGQDDSLFQLMEVLLDGRPAAHFTRPAQADLRVYIGAEDQLLPPGEHTYTIAFRTGLGLSTLSGLRRLRWNVTGDRWSLPIDQASATVELPASVDRDNVETEAYTGAVGAHKRDVDFQVDRQGRVQFRALRGLGVGEGMTILLSWPVGPGPQ